MTTFEEDAEQLREAWLDLAFEFGLSLGIIGFIVRRGGKLKPWAQQRLTKLRMEKCEHGYYRNWCRVFSPEEGGCPHGCRGRAVP